MFLNITSNFSCKSWSNLCKPIYWKINDANLDGVQLIREIKQIYSNFNYETKILAASIRTKNHVSQSAIAGADVATIPPKVFDTLINHNLTDQGLEIFNSDWKKSGQKIL